MRGGNRSAWALAAAALAVALAASAPARADGDDPRARASAQFAAAERAFEAEDYPEALRYFRAAFAIIPDDAVRFNIAVCLERLGRFREAGDEYAAAAESTALAPEVRDRARTEATRVRARLGRLVITGAPHGASVSIDGEPRCTLPCEVDADPGRREVVAGAGAARGVVVVERGAVARLALDATGARRRGVGPLTWIGGATAALGAGGAIVFGLRARALHADYLADPTGATRDDGLFARDLANVSIAAAAVGVALVALDVLVLARRPARARATASTALAFEF